MKAKLILLVLVVLMAGSFTTAAVALTKADDGKKDDKASHGKGHAKGHPKGHGKREDRPGPPPWAQGHRDKADKHAWKDAWRDLTPTQRADRMAEFAQQHAVGMKKWAACVKDAGEDRAARRACERPLPPGLAKRLPQD